MNSYMNILKLAHAGPMSFWDDWPRIVMVLGIGLVLALLIYFVVDSLRERMVDLGLVLIAVGIVVLYQLLINIAMISGIRSWLDDIGVKYVSSVFQLWFAAVAVLLALASLAVKIVQRRQRLSRLRQEFENATS